ncbi:hypothetical protein [Nocardioides sp. AX2bis]|uniref:hypothetical protein n=1 Tax=Nocardioides sp. AX2bis TaxID=2653157 RepID=UPI0012F2859A|nr:hypothetical protein [Nocardioides sp. AX2bis]VXB12867.1 conserved hypothetical protein [Nocardioides sp. AX2bis]
MAERVVLHIGTMKSGTTYLQTLLMGEGLEGSSGFYVGQRFGVQTAAVLRLMRGEGERRTQAWDRLVEEVGARDGVAVFSQEFLAFVGQDRVSEIVGSFAGTPVEVVLTVRDQHGALPAQWQSYVRNAGTSDLAAYLRELEGGDRSLKSVRSYRRAQHVPGIVRRWARHPDVSSFTAVVVPAPGGDRSELWRRFSRAAGLDGPDSPDPRSRTNESLGQASCEALRLLNEHLADLPRAGYETARDEVLPALLPLRAEEERAELDSRGSDLACALNAGIRRALGTQGVSVVGSLDELPVERPAGTPPGHLGCVRPPDPAAVHRALAAVHGTVLPGAGPPASDVGGLARLLGTTLAARHAG